MLLDGSVRARTQRLTADALSAHYDVVEVSVLRLWGAVIIPILQNVHGIDTVRAVAAHEIQSRLSCLDVPIHPELMHTIRLARVIETRVRLDAVPLTTTVRSEDRRDSVHQS